MTSNRIGGPNPSEPGKGADPRMQEQHRRIEKVEKVKAVDETENEQTRKKFQQFMGEHEPTEKPHVPSPLETGFYHDEETVLIDPSTTLEDLGNEAVPSPTYSAPPDITISPEANENENPPLPRSHNFWTDVDSPSDGPIRHPKFKETEKSISRTPSSLDAKNKKKDKLLAKEEIESLYGPREKALEKTKAKIEEEKKKQAALSPRKPKKSSSQEEAPMPPHLKEKELPSSEHVKKGKSNVAPIISSEKDMRINQEQHFSENKEEKNRGKKSNPIELESLPIGHLPAQVSSIAQAATIQASPYLNTQTIPLFFQMVGTIYVMAAPPGISKTEITLTSPAFANSKFFGATISIEKYATAPDSLNIRLTGTNEAVKTFNENLTNLYAAFQSGNFSFRIGRLSAEYSVEKPVFRRKEAGEQKRDSSGGDFSDRRGNK